ncbi:MAG: 50S ribosomal protein L4 [Phycisphaerae bacterium]|nr:50S ribosomal protein L4 [Phycisphaerae bacterium]
MLSIPVYNESGQQVGTEELDPQALGGDLNASLLKQAVVMYHANQRQGHAVQKTRAEVAGSTRKLYRQKGTGRARAGNLRTPVRRGGGCAFANKVRDFRQEMPKKMRRLARNQAVLAKIQGETALIVDGLKFDAPKTKRLATLLAALESDRGCVFATAGIDQHLFRSGRNIQRAEIMDVAELNAFAILSRKKLIFTKEAFDQFRLSLPVASA